MTTVVHLQMMKNYVYNTEAYNIEMNVLVLIGTYLSFDDDSFLLVGGLMRVVEVGGDSRRSFPLLDNLIIRPPPVDDSLGSLLICVVDDTCDFEVGVEGGSDGPCAVRLVFDDVLDAVFVALPLLLTTESDLIRLVDGSTRRHTEN